jgi:hypothetical protein
MTRFAFCFAIILSSLPASAATQERRITPVSGERRLALVVGNDAYAASPLRNAVADARAVARLLEDELGFGVTLVTDAQQEVFEDRIDRFIGELRAGDVGLFFYAGHGLEIGGQNYLLPVDFVSPEQAVQVKRRAVNAEEVLERMGERGAQVRLVILDACRDNPYRGTRSSSAGLRAMEAQGAFVAFATAPGRTASDNPGRANGLFTEALLSALREPGLTVPEIFRRVRVQVTKASDGRQFPWASDGLIGDLVLRPLAVTSIGGGAKTIPDQGAQSSAAREDLLWSAVKDSRTAAPIEDYLARVARGELPGLYRAVAEARLAELRDPPASAVAPSGRAAESNISRPVPTPPSSLANLNRPSAWRVDASSSPPTRSPDVIFVPTPHEVVEEMLRLARVGSEDTLYDLGSGDGRIPIAAAKLGARAVGIEINSQLISEAQASAERARVTDRVQFAHQDLFEVDLSKATVITLYLLPSLNVKLAPRLRALRPGTRIVSHSFDMGDWAPDVTRDINGRTVYMWIIR